MNITSVSPRMRKVRLGMIAAMAFAAVSSVAETRYFDTNGAVPGFGSANGDWKDGSALWSADPTGASETTAVLPAETDEAVFGTTENPIEAGTVQVYGPRKVATLSARPAVGEAVTFAAGDETATLGMSLLLVSPDMAPSSDVNFDLPVLADGNLTVSNVSVVATWANDLSATAELVIPGGTLADWEPASTKMYDGNNGGSWVADEWLPYHVVRTDTKLTVQFQGSNNTSYMYAYKVEFVQSAEGITARKIWSRYDLITILPLGSDFEKATKTTNRYHFRRMTFRQVNCPSARFCKGLSINGSLLIGCGAETAISGEFTGATALAVDGTLTISNMPSMTISAPISIGVGKLKVSQLASVTLSGSAVPQKGKIEVVDGGELFVSKAGSLDPGTFGSATIKVGKDAVLDVSNSKFAFPSGRRILEIDGGTVIAGTTSDKQTYVAGAVLRNGAFFNGDGGKGVDIVGGQKITVEGSTPSSWAGLVFTEKSKTTRTPLVFEVADVTGDESVDFTLKGTLRDYDANTYSYMQLSKTGAGTMEIAAQCTGAKRYPFLVNEGTLLLGVDDTLGSTSSKKVLIATNDVQMAGGTLAAKTGTKQTLKFLTVTADSTIDLRGTATMSFADSSAKAWTAGAKLNILCESTEQITFAGLSDDQIGALRVNGRRVRKLDDKGHPVFPGLILLLK